MSNIQIIQSFSQVHLSEGWAPISSFKSENKLVDKEGEYVDSQYEGRTYRLIQKWERTYSAFERIVRFLLAFLLVLFSFGIAYCFKTTRKLMFNPGETIRFALPVEKIVMKLSGKKVSYIHPKLLFQNEGLNFAEVTLKGKRKIMPVAPTDLYHEYVSYEGQALEALYKMAQKSSPISRLLHHPDNTLFNEEEVLNYLGAEERICTLSRESTIDLLKLPQARSLPLITMFNFWAGKGIPEISRLILALDPSIIHQRQHKLVEAILAGSQEEAEVLFEAMTSANISPSERESLYIKAWKGDFFYSVPHFYGLNTDIQQQLFYVGNQFGHRVFVKYLSVMICFNIRPIFCSKLEIVAANVPVIYADCYIEGFLKGLRKKGQLLTEREFNSLSPDSHFSLGRGSLGRFQGARYVEEIIQRHNFTHVRVIKELAVVAEGVSDLSLAVSETLELKAQEGQLTVYSEDILQKRRPISLEEAQELVLILEETGYKGPLTRHQIAIGQECVYLLDLNFENFDPTRLRLVPFHWIKPLLDPDDLRAFSRWYNFHTYNFQDRQRAHQQAQAKLSSFFMENPYRNLVKAYKDQAFTFAIGEGIL